MAERVGHAQRTMVLDLLNKALAEGYIELSEYEQRMSVVSAAKTASELTGQLADLPRQLQWNPQQHLPPTSQVSLAKSNGSARTMAVTALGLGIASIPMALCLGAGLVFGIAAAVLGLVALRARTENGMAVAGITVGCVGAVLSVSFIVFWVLTGSS